MTSEESTNYPFAAGNRNLVPSKIAGTATWTTGNTLQIDLKFVEAIHGDKLTCVFDGNKVSLSFLNSVSEHNKSNPDKRSKLLGTIT